jgi:antitoxin ParD1/3/4
VSSIEKISVALTGEQVESLNAAVASGEYASASDIVQEALRDWQAKRQPPIDDVRTLRALWDEGKASGSAGAVDFQVLRRDARARLAEAKTALAAGHRAK